MNVYLLTWNLWALYAIQSILSSHCVRYLDQTIQNYTKYIHQVWRCFWNTIWRQLTWKRKARNWPLWRKKIIYASITVKRRRKEKFLEGWRKRHPSSPSIAFIETDGFNWWWRDTNNLKVHQNECYMNSQILNLHVCGSQEEGQRSWTETRGMHNY